MNVLPIIADWLGEFNYREDSEMPRADLVAWITKPSVDLSFFMSIAQVYKLSSVDVELAVDCLIAAGIGRPQELNRTVYCRCSSEAI